MFTVVLVDDEPWALLGMLKSFQWEDLGFEIIAKTTNPLEAFDIIQEHKPDAVFADIKMPELTGIELLKLSRKKGITSEFVIVSGFAEFNYAKDAIEFGTFYYMLKPIDIVEGIGVLKSLAEHLTIKQANEKSKNDISFLDSILNGGNTLKNIIDCKYEFYQAVVIMCERELNFNKLNFAEEAAYIQLRLAKYKYILLFNCKSDIFPCLMKEDIIKHNVGDVNIGVSTLTPDPHGLLERIREADLAANSKFVFKKNGIYIYQKPSDSKSIKIIFKKIVAVLEQDRDENISCSAEKVSMIFTINQLGIEEVSFHYNNIIGYINLRVHREEPLLEYMDYEQICKEFRDIDDLSLYICNLFGDYLQIPKKLNSMTDTSNLCFNELLCYINSNYNKDLGLNELSEKFHLNVTYICDLFKKKTGITFTKYVTDIRLNKACELLKNTDMPIFQIAEDVGYEYYYFNTLFKKNFGITPLKVRRGE